MEPPLWREGLINLFHGNVMAFYIFALTFNIAPNPTTSVAAVVSTLATTTIAARLISYKG
ncbi:uncharacterized protein G2W53_029885 [Senna tora]|uniref:Uncharacterized protein n=1 Tax=Senna tora TaxID=362788 RepID=A0A834WE41_9FABA|nr:uncharacterized protein G2W53_029885 [Senna tora]